MVEGADLLSGVPAVAGPTMTVAAPVLPGSLRIERLRPQGTVVGPGTTTDEVTVTEDIIRAESGPAPWRRSA